MFLEDTENEAEHVPGRQEEKQNPLHQRGNTLQSNTVIFLNV